MHSKYAENQGTGKRYRLKVDHCCKYILLENNHLHYTLFIE
jgi:hypothetical protein